MNDADRALLGILAAVDAAFLPERPARPRTGDVRAGALRNAYSCRGIPWASSGNSNAERMAASRVLGGLADAGYLVKHTDGQRTSHVRLTDAGEARARALVGLPSLLDAMEQGRKFRKYVDPGSWLIEVVLAGIETSDWGEDRGPADPLMNLEERMLPLLLRGWAASIEDVEGRVSYTLSVHGAEAVAGKLPPAPEDLYDEAATGLYYDALGKAITAIRARRPEKRKLQQLRSCSDCYYDPKEHGRRGRCWPRDLKRGDDEGAES